MVAPCNEWHGVMCRCVECLQCEGLFSPQKFVCHSHSPENRTCHWGFDSSNWLTYLQVNTSRVDSLHLTLTFWIQLSEDYTKEERERHTKVMEDFKNRYCPALRAAQGAAVPREGKRRQVGLDLSSQFLPRHTHTPPPSIYACWNFLILEEHDMIDMISSVSVYITALMIMKIVH